MITLDLRGARAGFFDSEKVIRSVDKANRKNLEKTGYYVRKVAINRIKNRKRPSKPGESPTNHTGTLRTILFAFDDRTKSVVVGPMKTNQVFFEGDGRPVKGTIPQVLEKGGSVTIHEVQKWDDGVWRRADLRSKRRLTGRPQRRRTVRISARPYMIPALEASEKKISEIWKDSVKP